MMTRTIMMKKEVKGKGLKERGVEINGKDGGREK